MQENAAQGICQNIFRGCMPPDPPPLAKIRAYGARAERLWRPDLRSIMHRSDFRSGSGPGFGHRDVINIFCKF